MGSKVVAQRFEFLLRQKIPVFDDVLMIPLRLPLTFQMHNFAVQFMCFYPWFSLLALNF